MQPKQNSKDYIVGMYVRLSRDDERQGESLSIENQKTILSEYIEQQGWTLHDVYVDDGISGTTFERPGVKRLLEDAKSGVINTILVKDMSRFGRNYIMVGQYLDYVFPLYNIRFVALTDNIDTENKDTAAMDMMPITNVFNEWWAAATSKKLRAVRIQNAKNGKNGMSHAPYGYILGTDEKRTLQINEETAPIVKRIFEMRSTGMTPRKIADILNAEHILTPNDYRIATTGVSGVRNPSHLWHTTVLRTLLANQAYIGNLVQHKTTTVSYKNHKWQRRPEKEWIVIENAHEAIISKELWDKVKEVEKAVGHGKHTKRGFMHPLSGLMFCADCGAKMRLGWNTQIAKRTGEEKTYFNFNCGTKSRTGSSGCFSHFIPVPVLEQIVLNDVKDKAAKITANEDEFRRKYLDHTATLTNKNQVDVSKEIHKDEKRLAELDKLIESAFEEKVAGKIPESVCVRLIEKYTTEQTELNERIAYLKQGLEEAEKAVTDIDEFIRRMKQYLYAPKLTRELCLDLFEKLVIGGKESVTGKPQEVHIYYKVDIDSVL
ncbi:recombinase family protein [Pumilibacter intestinalis]|uniref:recombinase family protein n=1 Tax=Pumilibacter intestinalis TaxID=2941511 RepID=UPI00203F5A36|nr:recombinase family protein [Pumilibacter intestinalis]